MNGTPTRRRFLKGAAAGALAIASGLTHRSAQAQQQSFFRIATGSAGGTYFPIGGLLANAISNPPGSRPCGRGGSCGIPGMIAVAQSTHGSVQNARMIDQGMIESGFCQADVAYWAFTGSEIFREEGPLFNLRSIANLYPESVHLATRRAARIFKVADLRGKRISIDREGSGTRVDARLILQAYGLSESDVTAVSISAAEAAAMLRNNELDGFFFVAGAPTGVISNLATEGLIALTPIDGPEAAELRRVRPYFAADNIGSNTYRAIGNTRTLSVGAQWLISKQMPEDMVYELTVALWHDNTRKLLDRGHPRGKLIQLETALTGLGVPLHPGAARYYAEREMSVPAAIPPARPLAPSKTDN